MSLIVQKFGGTSVADTQKILAAARKAIRARQAGHQVVVVVSAMGHNTDHLIDLANEISDHPPAREMDMLLSTGEQVSVALMAMAIHELGHEAISMTGGQMGIKTDSTHTKARIQSITTDRMKSALDAGKIVIAAGFQGIDEHFNITTLGRGGSDTTAVALAAVLRADECEIYTDVDGVYTTDPRILPEARKAARISYDEMLELASLGAGVMHSRSIEFGKKFGVPIHVRSSFSDTRGTLIVADPESAGQPVSGAALAKDEARVSILGVPDRPGTSLAIFSKIAARNIAVDMIVQNVGEEGRADISFTVLRSELPVTLEAVQAAAAELGAAAVEHDENVSKVSVVGLGMATQTGVAQRMFRALAAESINIQMITTSEIKISCLVARDQGNAALRAVHRVFGLEKPPEAAAQQRSAAVTSGVREAIAPAAEAASTAGLLKKGDRHLAATKPPETARSGSEPVPVFQQAASPVDVVNRLHGMEDLAINEVTLDDSQARLTISGVPDKPGLAAQVFEQLARDGILVDMIVQSCGLRGRANLSCTVPASDLTRGVKLAQAVSDSLSCGPVTSGPHVGKLSVSGVGLRSHTGVAIRMFQALAQAGINVEMVNTSEVRVNVVVDGARSQEGLACLQRAFADSLR